MPYPLGHAPVCGEDQNICSSPHRDYSISLLHSSVKCFVVILFDFFHVNHYELFYKNTPFWKVHYQTLC